MATFYYEGNATVGNFLRERLEAADNFEVYDPTEAGVIFTYYSTPQAVENAYLDSEGLLQIAQEDALLIDLSPISPSFARELSALAQVSGLQFVEAPLALRNISAPNVFEIPGNVECCVAGIDDARAKARPLLETIFAQVHDCGGSGAAQLSHAAYAIQLVSLIVASAEASALFACCGKGAQDVCALGNAYASGDGSASCSCPPALTDISASLLDAMAAHRFEGSYTCEMLMGDIEAALSAAQDEQITLPQAEVCRNLLELLAVVGGADKSPLALVLDYSTEEEAASYGLDWSRAEKVSGAHDGCDSDDDDYYDNDYYDDYDTYDKTVHHRDDAHHTHERACEHDYSSQHAHHHGCGCEHEK